MICNGSPMPNYVAQYLEMMNQYLELQNRWMALYLEMMNLQIQKNDSDER